MLRKNLVTVHFEKRETALKWLIAAVAYCTLFAFMENPKDKTISLIGKEHLWLLMFYCLFSAVAVTVNFLYMYRHFDLKNKALKTIAVLSNAAFGLVLTTLMPSLAANGEISLFATIVHWIAGFGNIVINATVVLIFCRTIAKRDKNKKLNGVFAAGTAVCILDLLIFVGMTVILHDPAKSKNGLFEIIPTVVGFVVIYFINHTDIATPRAQRDKTEAGLKAADKSVFSAVSFVFFAASMISFTLFAFVRNPLRYTISMTGLEYSGGFALVCTLLAVCFLTNTLLMFKKSGLKNGFISILSVVGSLSIILCVAVPTTTEVNISFAHAVGALMFFYFLMASYLIFLFKRNRENKKYRPFLVLQAIIILGVLTANILMFLVLKQSAGRTGLVELIPLEFMFVFTYLENYTDYFTREKSKQSPNEKIEVKIKKSATR